MDQDTTFFSYSRADSEFVLKLAQDLRLRGANLWLDQTDIIPSSRWDSSIEAALKNANRLLVVLTPDSISSEHVMDEVSYALDEHKQVIPILLKPCDLPLRMRRLQHIDFVNDYDIGINKLLPVLVTKKHKVFEGEVLKSRLVKEQTINEDEQNTAKEIKTSNIPTELKKRQQEETKVKVDIVGEKYKKKANQLKNVSKTIAKVALLKKIKYHLPSIIIGSIIILAIFFWRVFFGGNHNNLDTEDPTFVNKQTTETQDWKEAKEDNTIEEYDKYLENYPNGLHTGEANENLNKIIDKNDWEKALSTNTKEAFLAYLDAHATGLYISEASKKIANNNDILVKKKQQQQQALLEKSKREEDKAWNVAKSLNTIASYRDYRQNFQNGKYYGKAEQYIDTLQTTADNKRIEEYAWKMAKSSNTLTSYQSYLKDYPNGTYSGEAKQNIDTLNVLSVGKKYLGGIIFYLDNTGQHGLIAAENDIRGPYTWNEVKKIIGVDWRLPTKEELVVLYKNKEKIGGFLDEIYWSSSEDPDDRRQRKVWIEFFNDKGGGFYNWKGLPCASARPVRNF